ncbi:MAG: 8-amino-7-oxononanoate synthase [Planctomycetes bacterium]|nr:8-amino-7-oxononanoate synthase [Planctomycetota bacterium]
MDPLIWIDEQLDRLRQQDLHRELPQPLKTVGPTYQVDGRELLNFASNDYLGLASDPRLVEAAAQSLQETGLGRGASPLICGRSTGHFELERQLAQFENTEAALLFASGFAANTGTIPALTGADDAIYSDAHNHASIVDGCRLSSAVIHIYPHNDVNSLECLLQAGQKYRRRLIVTDTLFSMDGDLAPMPQLGKLAEQYDAMLMVDEAHATGVFGEHGRGVVEHFSTEHPQLHQQVHVRVGTLSKAIGAAGGFVCGSQSLIQWLTNRARTYVFSTAQPAPTSAAASAALKIITSEPTKKRRNLLRTAAKLRKKLQAQDWNTGDSASQIIPLYIGPAQKTMQLAQQLRDRGCWVPGIRPPSVPEGKSLLRLCLSAAHDEKMLARVVEALAVIRKT